MAFHDHHHRSYKKFISGNKPENWKVCSHLLSYAGFLRFVKIWVSKFSILPCYLVSYEANTTPPLILSTILSIRTWLSLCLIILLIPVIILTWKVTKLKVGQLSMPMWEHYFREVAALKLIVGIIVSHVILALCHVILTYLSLPRCGSWTYCLPRVHLHNKASPSWCGPNNQSKCS